MKVIKTYENWKSSRAEAEMKKNDAEMMKKAADKKAEECKCSEGEACKCDDKCECGPDCKCDKCQAEHGDK